MRRILKKIKTYLNLNPREKKHVTRKEHDLSRIDVSIMRSRIL